MLTDLILQLASWWQLGTSVGGDHGWEQTVNLPVGTSIISSAAPWQAVSGYATEALPTLQVISDTGTKTWHQAIAPSDDFAADWELEHSPYITPLLFAGDEKTQLIIHTDVETTLTLQFFALSDDGDFLARSGHSTDDDFLFDIVRPGLTSPRFISREQWGADETLRWWKSGRGWQNVFRQSLPEATNVTPDIQANVVRTRDSSGHRLTWPIEENQVIKKIIVHHTGEYLDENRDPRSLMRSIYYYHTITRGWGDIGYHYVIDPQGNIYEGRAGGELAVGAHVAYHNLGSIGISLMGNFNNESPTSAALGSLSILSGYLAHKFNLNPDGRSVFLGRFSNNISGHRQVTAANHGTSCPGTHLHRSLQRIRAASDQVLAQLSDDLSQPQSRDFLAKSSAARTLRRSTLRNPSKIPEVSLAKIIPTAIISRGRTQALEVELRNGSDFTWPKGSSLLVKNVPEGVNIGKFRSVELIRPGRTGIFRASVTVTSADNNKYNLTLVPDIPQLAANTKLTKTFIYPLQVSGDANTILRNRSVAQTTKQAYNHQSASSVSTPRANSQRYVYHAAATKEPTALPQTEFLGPPVKVKLSYFSAHYAAVTSADSVIIKNQKETVATIPPNLDIDIRLNNRVFHIAANGQDWSLKQFSLHTMDPDGVLKIKNYDRNLGKIPYNQFRRQLNFHLSGPADFFIVNELPIEAYLWGLAEEPSTEPEAKKHAIHILARSYALVYSGAKRKFGTVLYDLEDSPKTSQFYLGYDWERYHGVQKKKVAETFGKVITYDNRAVIGPYFTQSSGESSDAWRHQYPWTKKQKLPHDEGLPAQGHGVGLSGNTARELAKEGYHYEQILDYFFTDISIAKKY